MKWNKLITLIILLSLFAYLTETEQRVSRSIQSLSAHSLSFDSLQKQGKYFLLTSSSAEVRNISQVIQTISLPD